MKFLERRMLLPKHDYHHYKSSNKDLKNYVELLRYFERGNEKNAPQQILQPFHEQMYQGLKYGMGYVKEQLKLNSIRNDLGQQN